MEMFVFLIQVSLRFVHQGQADNKAALVQVMAWRLFGAKPLPEPVMITFYDAIWSHKATMG